MIKVAKKRWRHKAKRYEISYEKAFEDGSWFVLFMLIYPSSIKIASPEKIEKLIYNF